MSEKAKTEINVKKDQLTIDEKGQVVIVDPEVLEQIKNAQGNTEEGGWTVNFIC